MDLLYDESKGKFLLQRAEEAELQRQKQHRQTKAQAVNAFGERAAKAVEHTDTEPLTDDRNGVATINGLGEVISVSSGLTALSGYTASDLVGQNVNVLVPSPFAEMHDNFLRAYIDSGKDKIINSTRTLFLLQKVGFILPVYVRVKQVSGLGRLSPWLQ